MAAFAVSQSPTDVEQNRQHAQLARIGLAAGDQKLLIGIISDFNAKHDALVAEYNAYRHRRSGTQSNDGRRDPNGQAR